MVSIMFYYFQFFLIYLIVENIEMVFCVVLG